MKKMFFKKNIEKFLGKTKFSPYYQSSMKYNNNKNENHFPLAIINNGFYVT